MDCTAAQVLRGLPGVSVGSSGARPSFPRPNATAGTSKAKPTLHGNKFFIQISLSTPIIPATTAKHREAQSRTQGGCYTPCSTPETPSLGCGPEVPGHGRARTLHQHLARKEPPLLSLSALSIYFYSIYTICLSLHKPVKLSFSGGIPTRTCWGNLFSSIFYRIEKVLVFCS